MRFPLRDALTVMTLIAVYSAMVRLVGIWALLPLAIGVLGLLASGVIPRGSR